MTQTPKDVPSEVLAQLGNRVQHALRAFTPDDAKALKATVSTFPQSDAYDLTTLLTSMGIGEAAVTILSERGAPTPVAWTPPAPAGVAHGPARPGRAAPGSCRRRRCWRSTARPSTASRRTSGCSPRWPRREPEPDAPEPEPARGARAAPGGAPRSRGRRSRKVLGSSVFRSFARSAASAAGREISRSLFGTAPRRRAADPPPLVTAA